MNHHASDGDHTLRDADHTLRDAAPSIRDARILVTGGCGSIGSRIVAQLLEADPALVRVLDNSERELAAFKGRHEGHADTLELVLANVREKDQLAIAMGDVDVVFHVAAMKHVPMVEDNPYAAVQTNVDGTRNVVEAAHESGVKRLLGVSTDKAANPTSTMGSTKLIAERLLSSFDAHRSSGGLVLGSVRFGNVLGTHGSVVPRFFDQIRAGGPLTVTDPAMTRFVMLPSEAAAFAIDACLSMDGGEVAVKKMPALSVGDLAEAMVETYAPAFGYDPAEIEVEYVGAKPGERYHEKLVAADEVRYATEHEDRFVLYPHHEGPPLENELSGEYTSANARRLDREEIVSMVRAALDDTRTRSPDLAEEAVAVTDGSGDGPFERDRDDSLGIAGRPRDDRPTDA